MVKKEKKVRSDVPEVHDDEEKVDGSEANTTDEQKSHAEGVPGKGKGKGKKGKSKLPPLPRQDADNPLVKEVVDIILAGIADAESQKDGKSFVPAEWATTYKPKLGPYKKFLTAHPDKFALVEDGTGKFIIKRPQDVDPNHQTQAPLIKGTTWQKKLIDAWMAYCLSVPREKRDFDLFLEPLPRAARSAKLAGETPEVVATPNDSHKVGKKRKQGAESEVAASTEVASMLAAISDVSKKKKKKRKAPVDA